MKDSSPDWILSALLAGAAFFVAFIVADFAFPLALFLCALAFAGGTLVFRVKARVLGDGTATPEDLESALADGRRKLDGIMATGRKIRDRETRAKVEALGETVGKILAEVRRDPADLKRARQFLSYYLDATANILNKYHTLSSQNVADAGIAASLERTEATLDTVNQAFGKQLARLLSNDVMDLDAELSLLEQTIRMEGLGDA